MKNILEQKIQKAIEGLQGSGELLAFEIPEIRVERPKDAQFGEYTTNISLVLAKPARKSPLIIAELLKTKLVLDEFEKVEVVAPGYINFYLSQNALSALVREILTQKEGFGASEMGAGVRVNNEFISANPTGPLHVGNGRGGIFGDVLTRVLRKVGFDVMNEYYVNDAGEQIIKLGHSVLKDDEAVYGGEYIEELNQQLARDDQQKTVKQIGEWAAEVVLEKYIKQTLAEKMGVIFDMFTSEKCEIIEKGYVDKALEILKQKGITYESEGALWLKTTEFGDDKDRVLVKSDGVRTYFTSDCGYILHKMDRGFTRLILILGADHHGYKLRLRAAAQALGFSGTFDFVFVQMVRLMKNGEEVRMSKRAGNVVTIDELVELVGVDVTRCFFLMYAPETHMNFDIGLAEERSQKNPVFYVQYAHARLSSILRKAEEEHFGGEWGDLALLVHPKERELMRELSLFPELIQTVATEYTVHKLPQYAIGLADRFHSFYNECKVIDEEQREVSLARLELIKAVKVVLAETLHLMGITAPDKM